MIEVELECGSTRKLNVQSAVRVSVRDHVIRGDQVQSLADEVHNLTTLNGRIIELLVTKGILTEQDVCDVLPGKANVVDA